MICRFMNYQTVIPDLKLLAKNNRETFEAKYFLKVTGDSFIIHNLEYY